MRTFLDSPKVTEHDNGVRLFIYSAILFAVLRVGDWYFLIYLSSPGDHGANSASYPEQDGK